MVASVPATCSPRALLGLGLGVDVGVVAVPLVGQLLHRRVVEVARAEAEHGEKDAAAPLLLDQADQLGVARHADVEVAVGGEDDAVRAAADEVLFGDAVGELYPRAAVGRAARLKPLDRRDYFSLAVAGRRGQREPARAGVGDDGHAVARPQLVGERPQGRLDEPRACRARSSSPRRRRGRRGWRAAGLPPRPSAPGARCGRAGAARPRDIRRPRP